MGTGRAAFKKYKYVGLTSRLSGDKRDIRGWGNGDTCFAMAEFVIKPLPVMTLKVGHVPSKSLALGSEVGKQSNIVCVCCYLLHFIR